MSFTSSKNFRAPRSGAWLPACLAAIHCLTIFSATAIASGNGFWESQNPPSIVEYRADATTSNALENQIARKETKRFKLNSDRQKGGKFYGALAFIVSTLLVVLALLCRSIA